MNWDRFVLKVLLGELLISVSLITVIVELA